MSNLLNESIVDAKALRASALKNAESVVIEKYADEVKRTLENLLEQDEFGAPEADMPVEPADMGVDLAASDMEDTGETEEVVNDQSDNVPLAAANGLADNQGKNLGSMPSEGENVEITLDLGSLQEAIEALSAEIDEEVEVDLSAPTLEEGDDEDLPDDDGDGVPPWADKDDDDPEVQEESTEPVQSEKTGIEEQLFDAVMEKLTADMGFELSGWAGRPTSQLKDEQERELAKEASTESEEEEALDAEQEDFNESNEKLEKVLSENKNFKEKLVNYQSTMEELKENLYAVNLSNARLLYTNRVLRNSSLNERQKNKIVEAISGAGSVAEAKTIYETLQSTVEAKPKRSPQSLSEAIGNRSSVLTASRKETKATSQDPLADRMRRLAGIK
jgi:hypothetical protein